MPLVWAHAEYVKLAASIQLGHPFDRVTAVWERYAGKRPDAEWWCWSLAAPIDEVVAGKGLLIHLPGAAVVHWSADGWQSVHDDATQPTGLGVHQFAIAPDVVGTAPSRALAFTFRWTASEAWAGRNFHVRVVDADDDAA